VSSMNFESVLISISQFVFIEPSSLLNIGFTFLELKKILKNFQSKNHLLMYSNDIKEIYCKFILLINNSLYMVFFIVTSTNSYKHIVEIVVIIVVILYY